MHTLNEHAYGVLSVAWQQKIADSAYGQNSWNRMIARQPSVSGQIYSPNSVRKIKKK